MENGKLLERFLFDDALAVNEKKERFQTAWEISRAFVDIVLEADYEAWALLEERVNDAFRGLTREENYLPEEEKEEVIFYKPEWIWSDRGCLLYYVYQGPPALYHVGVKKYSDREGIPFAGPWTAAGLTGEVRETMKRLAASVDALDRRWQARQTFALEYLLPNTWVAWKPDRDWLVHVNPVEVTDMEFNRMIFEKGKESAVDFCVKHLREFRLATEHHIDAFVAAYKRALKT